MPRSPLLTTEKGRPRGVPSRSNTIAGPRSRPAWPSSSGGTIVFSKVRHRLPWGEHDHAFRRTSEMRVWVFQTGEYLPYLDDHNRPMRAASVVRALVSRGHLVTLWTADFIHHELTHRYGRNTRLRATESVEIRFVHSPGYRANIGAGRLYDHAVLAANLRATLRDEPPPDVAFVGFPPVESAAVMVHWLRAHGVPVVIDVKDQWPQTLLRPVPGALQPIGRIALAPYYHLARRAMREADAISSISVPFLDWALDFARRERTPLDMVLPLTTPGRVMEGVSLDEAKTWWARQGVTDDGGPKLIFIGRLTSILELEPVLHAADACPDWQLLIGGNGPEYPRLLEWASTRPNVHVPGWLDQARAEVLHRMATAMIIPYRQEEAFSLSIPNKAVDAFAHGLPIVTGLSGYLADTLQERGIGRRYSSAVPLDSILREWERHPSIVASMSKRAREFYDEEFPYDVTYSNLVDSLELMGQG